MKELWKQGMEYYRWKRQAHLHWISLEAQYCDRVMHVSRVVPPWVCVESGCMNVSCTIEECAFSDSLQSVFLSPVFLRNVLFYIKACCQLLLNLFSFHQQFVHFVFEVSFGWVGLKHQKLTRAFMCRRHIELWWSIESSLIFLGIIFLKPTELFVVWMFFSY